MFLLYGSAWFLDCDDICMCVVNKHFELLEFVLMISTSTSNPFTSKRWHDYSLRHAPHGNINSFFLLREIDKC